jgi:hypothetical protein
LRGVFSFRHHKGHGFTRKAHLAVRQHRPLRHQGFCAMLAGKIEKTYRLHTARAHGVLAGQHRMHAGIRPRLRHIQLNDACVRPVRPQEMAIQLPRQAPIRRELPLAGQQAMIFQSRYVRAVDFKLGGVHGRGSFVTTQTSQPSQRNL